MPVTFTRRVLGTGRNNATVNAAAFTVITRSGARKTPMCATLQPAINASERHTVLLVGELGDARDDPPVSVEVTGDLALEGGGNGRGLKVDVTPLRDGPALVLAFAYAHGSIESSCPGETKQVVMVVWAGGVTPVEGKTDDDHLGIYRVETESGVVIPFALGDLGDQDNYVHLCLKDFSPVTRVSATAGILKDPAGDVNPETSVVVVQ